MQKQIWEFSFLSINSYISEICKNIKQYHASHQNFLFLEIGFNNVIGIECFIAIFQWI